MMKHVFIFTVNLEPKQCFHHIVELQFPSSFGSLNNAKQCCAVYIFENTGVNTTIDCETDSYSLMATIPNVCQRQALDLKCLSSGLP